MKKLYKYTRNVWTSGKNWEEKIVSTVLMFSTDLLRYIGKWET